MPSSSSRIHEQKNLSNRINGVSITRSTMLLMTSSRKCERDRVTWKTVAPEAEILATFDAAFEASEPFDPIAKRFARLVSSRRARLLALVGNARRREARRA